MSASSRGELDNLVARHTCLACGSLSFEKIEARETMWRTGERFTYLECNDCGTLRIAHVPTDMSPYYPADYYSFRDPWKHKSQLRRAVKRALLPVALRLPNSPAAAYFRHHAQWLFEVENLQPTSRILDVGCGKGHLLHLLREWGFTNLTGTDPYLSEEIRMPGLLIRKAEITEITDQFDVVMMHHSLEHVADPVRVMAGAVNLLAPGGSMIVRLPLKGGYLWDAYGTDWVQLDAPRHLTLFTKGAFLEVTKRLGLRPASIIFDADAFSVRASEAIRRGQDICEEFSLDEEAQFARTAEQLNKAGLSDQACFVLRRA